MTTKTSQALTVRLRRPHPAQQAFIDSPAKRKVVRAGRRSGKTTGAAHLGVLGFLAGHRVLYATPTEEQVEKFWYEVKRSLQEPVDAGVFVKNETKHSIERPGTEQRIRAKTAFNADTLRGDYADLLILDEFQLMDEDAWELVGAPMLLDNDGDAVFIYTPPSLHSHSLSKARDPRHAAKLFARAQGDATGRWQAFHFTSRSNPFLSPVALSELFLDMTALAIRQEIEAEDVGEAAGALWTRALLERCRVSTLPVQMGKDGVRGLASLSRIVIGVDPPGGSTECGIVAAGIAPCSCRGEMEQHGFVLADSSLQASPDQWAEAVLTVYQRLQVDRVVGEANYGGDMVENTIRSAARARNSQVSYKSVHATRGKAVRAEPVAAAYEQGRVHHLGSFPHLEDEMVLWTPGETKNSPNRLDALVWALTELMVTGGTANVRWLG